jgi:hypothetical protein
VTVGLPDSTDDALIQLDVAGSPEAAVYTWLDKPVMRGVIHFYWLADADVHGRETLHGPVSVVVEGQTWQPLPRRRGAAIRDWNF